MGSREYYSGKSTWNTPGNTENIRKVYHHQGNCRGLRDICFGGDVLVRDAATLKPIKLQDQFGKTIRVF